MLRKKSLQVEFLEPEPGNDVADGHDVGVVLLAHAGQHHQRQLHAERAQALQGYRTGNYM